jgi:hypothetical protein
MLKVPDRYKNSVYFDRFCRSTMVGRVVAPLIERGVLFKTFFNSEEADLDKRAKALDDEAGEKASFAVFLLGGPEADASDVCLDSLFGVAMSLYENPERTVVVFDLAGVPTNAREVFENVFQHMKYRCPDLHVFNSIADGINFLADKFGLADAA